MTKERQKEIAVNLSTTLKVFPWFSSVGVGKDHGEDVLIVYTTKKLEKINNVLCKLPTHVQGTRVKPVFLGRVLPA